MIPAERERIMRLWRIRHDPDIFGFAGSRFVYDLVEFKLHLNLMISLSA